MIIKGLKFKGILIIAFLILVVFVYKSDPAKGPILPCLFHTITGLHCPGCGMTRAVNALMHFNFKEAAGYNILPFILIPMLSVFYIFRKNTKKREPIAIAMVIIAVLFMILRNMEPFSFLAPV